MIACRALPAGAGARIILIFSARACHHLQSRAKRWRSASPKGRSATECQAHGIARGQLGAAVGEELAGRPIARDVIQVQRAGAFLQALQVVVPVAAFFEGAALAGEEIRWCAQSSTASSSVRRASQWAGVTEARASQVPVPSPSSLWSNRGNAGAWWCGTGGGWQGGHCPAKHRGRASAWFSIHTRSFSWATTTTMTTPIAATPRHCCCKCRACASRMERTRFSRIGRPTGAGATLLLGGDGCGKNNALAPAGRGFYCRCRPAAAGRVCP